MKYQLVIQFPETLTGGFDLLIKLEDILENNLKTSEVDGHDIGSGEMNIFIYTDEPELTFNEIKNLFKTEKEAVCNMKAAYRDAEKEEFICIWPKGLQEFHVA
jgi:hypothetical protein